jgi:beta-glucosidase
MTNVEIDALLQQMTLAEKIGQMTQVEKNSISPADVRQYGIGSVLSGGGGNPPVNNPQNWAAMTRPFLEAALETRLRIPLIYGADCVHGHANMYGATVFPHNIGLGAANDEALVEEIGYITGREMLAVHVHWNFAPCLAVPQDARWGRTYEGYAGDVTIVSRLGAAYVRGLQRAGVAACIKHYAGDGGAEWGTRQHASWATFWEQNGGLWQIDQGDVNVDEPTFRALHLAPYQESIEAGALTVMASFSSWRGLKTHANRYLLTDVLKKELGFKGFVVTDWMGINQLSRDYYTCVVMGINAGIDMVMVPFDYVNFITTTAQAVENGDIPIERIDDAVRRILYVKRALGLFERPFGDQSLLAEVGSGAHHQTARRAVQKSAVCLKNERAALPIPADVPTILLSGPAADDIGLQAGGWTIEWMGRPGRETIPGQTLLTALRAHLPDTEIIFDAEGSFPQSARAPLGIVVAAERPYAEGVGDAADLTLCADDLARIERMRPLVEKVILVLYSGRPLIINAALPLCDAVVAAWLPGAEGVGLADVLCGHVPFTGRLPQPWPAAMDQLPQGSMQQRGQKPLFELGSGLSY